GTTDTLSAQGVADTLSIAGPYSQYLWSTTETTPSIIVTDSGTYTAAVLDSSGCQGTTTFHVALAAPIASVELSLDDMQAAPGETTTLHVTIKNSQNIGPLSATDFSYQLSFDKSLLQPTDAAIAATSTYNGPWRTVTVTGKRSGTTGLM